MEVLETGMKAHIQENPIMDTLQAMSVEFHEK
jgi:hypothetical protein